jgi:hypothetical protein
VSRQCFRQLPAGTRVSLTLTADGWEGMLQAEGRSVQMSGCNNGGKALSTLAYLWLDAHALIPPEFKKGAKS